MAPLDAGGYGQELGGDPAEGGGVDDADGGLDGSDTQDDRDDDTETTTSRRLRDDATSDPMSDPTEPEPEDVATDDGNIDAEQVQTTTTTSTTSTEQFGEELGGDPAEGGGVDDDTDSDGGGGDSDFDPEEHLDGGDDAADIGDDDGSTDTADDHVVTDDGNIDVGESGTPDDTGDGDSDPIDAGGFGEELGGDPAGDADRTPGPTPEDVVDPDSATPEQGIEEGGATPEVEQQAQEFEQQIVRSTPGVTEEDVSISLVGTEAGVVLRAQFTEGAEGRVQDRLIDAREDVVTSAQEDADVREAVEGVGGADLLEPTRTAQRGALSDLRAEVEGDIEGQVGADRARRAGITNPTLRENVVENVDLEAGEDFTINVRETPGGDITVDAELTEEFSREEAGRAFERGLRNQFGVDVEEGEDFRVVEDEEGDFEPELTEQGQGKVNLSTIDRTVRDVERGDIPIITDLTGIRGPRFNIPGEGAVVPTARDTSILTIEEDTYTLADLGADFGEAVRGGLNTLESGIEEQEAELRQRDVEITGGYGTGQPNPLREAAFAGVGDFASILGQGVALPTQGSRFIAAGIESRRAGEFGEFTETASVTGQRLPAEFASGQIGRFRDEPVRATGGLVGTLAGTALTMRAFPRSRFLIQPGEEIAGIGGFGLTRRVAGERTAQRFFPNQEPLIFSEEAVIRTVRGAGRRASGIVGRAESGVGRVTRPAAGRVAGRLGEAGRRSPTVRLTTDSEAGLVDLDPAVREQVGRAARRPGEAARSAVETARQAPGRVRAGAVETGRDVLDTGRQSIERGRQTLTRLELEAEDAAFRAGQRTAAGVERARQLPSELVESPGQVASGLRQRGASAIETGRQRLTLAELQAEEFGFRAGERTAGGVNRLLDIEPSDLGSGRLTGAVETGRQRFTALELRAEEFGFRARQRTAAAVERAEQLPGAVTELPARGRAGATDLLSTGRQRLTLAELQAEELGFRAGQRTAAGVGRVEGILGEVADAPGRVRAAPREAVAGFQIGRGAAGLSDIPGFEAFPGQIQTGRAFEAGFETGETVSGLGDQARGLLARPRDRLVQTGETLGGLPDLTLRIEPGVPRRPVVSDAAFEFESGEADVAEPFGSPFETGETEVEDVDDPPLDPMETGRGEGPLMLSVESELKGPSGVETEFAAETVRPRLESAIGTDLGAEGSLAAGEVLVGDVRGGQMERVRLGLEEELGLDLEQEQEQELETETEFERLFDLELEQEAEAEAEAEAEFETRSELELEAEGELFDRRRRQDEDETTGLFGESRELVERDLLNPFTGR